MTASVTQFILTPPSTPRDEWAYGQHRVFDPMSNSQKRFSRPRASTVANDGTPMWTLQPTGAAPSSYSHTQRPRSGSFCGAAGGGPRLPVRRKPVPKLSDAELRFLESDNAARARARERAVSARPSVVHLPVHQFHGGVGVRTKSESKPQHMHDRMARRVFGRRNTSAKSNSRPTLPVTTNTRGRSQSDAFREPERPVYTTSKWVIERRADTRMSHSARRRYGMVFDTDGEVLLSACDHDGNRIASENYHQHHQQQRQRMLHVYASSMTLSSVSGKCAPVSPGGLSLGKLGVKISVLTKAIFTRRH